MTTESKTVYDLRYALSTGVQKMEAIPVMHGNMISAYRPHVVLRPKDWAGSAEEAKTKFEEMKLKKIKHLREQLEFVSKMEFQILGNET